jgi:hypothetical protein
MDITGTMMRFVGVDSRERACLAALGIDFFNGVRFPWLKPGVNEKRYGNPGVNEKSWVWRAMGETGEMGLVTARGYARPPEIWERWIGG